MPIYYAEATPDLANANIGALQSGAVVTQKEVNTLKGVDTTQSMAAQLGTANSVVMPDMASNIMLEATGTLTQANITGMNGAAVTLIAAPAAGSAHIIDEIELFHSFSTTAYTNGGDVSIQYGSAVKVITLIDVSFVTAGSSAKSLINGTVYDLDSTTGTGTGFDINACDNKAITIQNATAAFAAGNAANVIKWRIRYHTVTLLA